MKITDCCKEMADRMTTGRIECRRRIVDGVPAPYICKRNDWGNPLSKCPFCGDQIDISVATKDGPPPKLTPEEEGFCKYWDGITQYGGSCNYPEVYRRILDKTMALLAWRTGLDKVEAKGDVEPEALMPGDGTMLEDIICDNSAGKADLKEAEQIIELARKRLAWLEGKVGE